MTDQQEPRRRGRPKREDADVEPTKTETVEASDAQGGDVEELLKANQEFNEENERLRKEIEALKAKNNPVSITRGHEAAAEQVGQDGERLFNDDGLVHVQTQALDDPRMIAKADLERFMNEPVTVEIHEVSEDQADQVFEVFSNGQVEVFRRGERKTVKRKFVESLARAKKTGYQNVEYTDENGVRGFKYPAKTGLRYPFAVLEDANPRGRDWLNAVLRQP